MTKQEKAKLAAMAAVSPAAASAFVEVIAPIQIKNNPDAYVLRGAQVDFTGFDWQNAGVGTIKGEKGDKGDPGPKGDKGDDGKRGSFTFTANINVSSDSDVSITDLVIPDGVAPAVNDHVLDVNGDLYLITAVADGKVHVGNALAVNLKGPKGDAGAQGPKGDKGDAGAQGPAGPKGDKGDPLAITKTFASIKAMNDGFATDGVPVGSLVMIDTGDVNDEDNAKLYVKGDEAYTYITDLSGATGLTGPQGEQGPQGIQGPKGDKGDAGAAGPKGDKGDPGAAGADGKSAYQLWTELDGNADKSEDDFFASLKGAKGDTGEQGPKGDAGAQGPKGDKGDPGAKGDKGDTGTKGDTGARGTVTLLARIDVMSGATINVTDLVIPDGVVPAINDYVLDIKGDMYLITALATGTVTVGDALPVNLKGPQGDGANLQFVSDDFINSLFA